MAGLNGSRVECRKLHLTALMKVYKETMHKVGVGTDEPHAEIKSLKEEITET